MGPEQEKLKQEIADLGPWFHNLTIDGVQTAPHHPLGDYPNFKWREFSSVIPEDLNGASVLDVGCNAGFYAIEMHRRGAGEVVAIDTDEHYLTQARFAAEKADAPITFRKLDVYGVAELGRRFDFVIFMGVFYHLRHPLLALDLLWEHAVGDRLLFQSMQRGPEGDRVRHENYRFDDWTLFDDPLWPRLHFVEKNFADDPTNWFVPNPSAVPAMLRSAGFSVLEHPEPEVLLCARTERPAHTPPPPRIAAG